MRRSVPAFLVLLAAIGIFLFLHQRVVALFSAAMLLSGSACAWYMWCAFRLPAEKRVWPSKLQAVLLMLLLVFDLLAYIGVFSLREQLKVPVVAMSEPEPTAEWSDAGSHMHHLAEFSGHRVMAHFWASWCVPCRKELPQLLAFARRHPETTFVLFDVKDISDKANGLVLRSGGDVAGNEPANVIYALDNEGTLAYDAFHIHSFPSTVLVDPQGVMRTKFITPVSWNEDFFAQYMHK